MLDTEFRDNMRISLSGFSLKSVPYMQLIFNFLNPPLNENFYLANAMKTMCHKNLD